MMARFCAYVEKVFSLGSRVGALRDARPRPVIPTTGVFASAFVMFATGRGALNALESDLRIPARLRGLVGPRPPSCDTIGRVYAGIDSQCLARQWQEIEDTKSWYWATTLSQRQLPTRRLWRAGHGRWDIENDCFNTLCTHWGLDHCYKHDPTAVINFTLTLFIVFVLLQCFWLRNLKPQRRVQLTLIALAGELDRTLSGCQAPWYCQFLRGP